MMKHSPSYTVERYAGSAFASKITVLCSCGTRRTLSDGATAPTMKRARAAHAAHVAKAKALA